MTRLLTPADEDTWFWMNPADDSTVSLIGNVISQIEDSIGSGKFFGTGVVAERYIHDDANRVNGLKYAFGGVVAQMKELKHGTSRFYTQPSTYMFLNQCGDNAEDSFELKHDTSPNNSVRIDTRNRKIRIKRSGVNTDYSYGSTASRTMSLITLIISGPDPSTDFILRENGVDVTPVMASEDFTNIKIGPIFLRVNQNTVPSVPYGMLSFVGMDTTNIDAIERVEGSIMHARNQEHLLDPSHPWKDAPPVIGVNGASGAGPGLGLGLGLGLIKDASLTQGSGLSGISTAGYPFTDDQTSTDEFD